MKQPPTEITGTSVYVSGEIQECQGGEWLTIVPEDENDNRLWEFDQISGRLLQTK